MKKIISLLLAICMISSFVLPAFASSAKNELDLTQYTLEDIANMSADEYRQLLSDFERVYDPFDTYKSDPIMKEETYSTVTPRWSSGKLDKDGNLVELGSHETISAQAFSVMTNDMGRLSDPSKPDVVYALLSISLASLLPDKDENDSYTFKGHFYHAIDGDNFLGEEDDTALVNCYFHFYKALFAAKSATDLNDTKNLDIAYNHMGRALHYLQDAGEPHHAANYTNVTHLSHHEFESFVHDNINKYTDTCITAIGHRRGYTYSDSRNKDVDYFVQGISTLAYNDRGRVDSIFNQSEWDATANVTITRAVNFSAVLIYKLYYEAGIQLYK